MVDLLPVLLPILKVRRLLSVADPDCYPDPNFQRVHGGPVACPPAHTQGKKKTESVCCGSGRFYPDPDDFYPDPDDFFYIPDPNFQRVHGGPVLPVLLLILKVRRRQECVLRIRTIFVRIPPVRKLDPVAYSSAFY
jgi:hypothetical protein